MKIALIDDNTFNLELLKGMLSIIHNSFKVCSYDNSHKFLESDRESYHLILTDITMPCMSGYELFNLLRNTHHITAPIIAVTALAVDGDKDKILMHGFDNYLAKPFKLDMLKEMVEHYSKA